MSCLFETLLIAKKQKVQDFSKIIEDNSQNNNQYLLCIGTSYIEATYLTLCSHPHHWLQESETNRQKKKREFMWGDKIILKISGNPYSLMSFAEESGSCRKHKMKLLFEEVNQCLCL